MPWCSSAAGRPDGVWPWGRLVLLMSGRAAPQLPPAPPPPEGALQPLVQPPPAALTGWRQKSSPAPHRPPLLGVPPATPLLPLPSLWSHESPRRSQGRPCPGPPFPAGAGNGPRGCPVEPQRGGLAALGPLHRPKRGRPAGGRNQLAKAGPGQQPGRLPATKGTSRASGVISLTVVSKYYTKGLKAAEIALAVLIKPLVWLPPPAPVSQVARNGNPADSLSASSPQGRKRE